MSSSRDRNALKFASREDYAVNLLRRNPASEDFCTDSLLFDSSKIPTPSPSKKKTSNAFESKPRRAIGNTRTLKAAWEATANSARPSFSEGEAPSMQSNLKALPTQARSTRTSEQGSPEQSRSTPSPPQEAQDFSNLSSPHDFPSSPPPALADTYRRIAEEQELTENEWVKEEYTDSSLSGGNSSDDRRARSSSNHRSRPPRSVRGSKRATRRAADSNKENEGENTGVTDGTDLSFLQDLTDQNLAAKLTPHALDKARDRARLDKAIQQPAALAFSKAQVGSRHSLSAENLVQSSKNGVAGSVQSSSNGSTRSARTADNTPPPNVPKTWGSKGRVDRDWLRRIHDRTGSPAGQGSTTEFSQIERTPAPAEDVPLPSTEGSSTLLSGGSRRSTPGSRRSTPVRLAAQNSLDRIRQWELNDITGHNLSVSTSPPVKIGIKAQDQSRSHEIEVLEKRAVTTNRLGEIVKKNSSGHLAVKLRRFSEGAPTSTGDLGLIPAAENDAIPEIQEEGEPIPQTPIVVFKGSTTGIEKEGRAESGQANDRKDSIDNLQRLARAMSESPKPAAATTYWPLNGQEEAHSARATRDEPVRTHGISRKLSEKLTAIKTTPAVNRSSSADAAGRTPTVAGAWTDTVLPDTAKTIKQSAAPFRYAQTPHVTGGWIETPLVPGKRQPPPVDPMSDVDSTDQRLSDVAEAGARSEADVKEAQHLPRSALTSLLTRAKRKLISPKDEQQGSLASEDEEGDRDGRSEKKDRKENDTLNLGDATIESLEGLLTLDEEEMSTLLGLGGEVEAREKFDARVRSEEVEDESQLVPFAGAGSTPDAELIGRLGPRLQNICTNIHDVRKGITALEQQLSQPADGSSDDKSKHVPSCQSCGCPHGGNKPHHDQQPRPLHSSPSRFYLTLPIPQLYRPPRKNLNQHLPRPTPLGYLLLVLWTWYATESILCSRYCHPPFAEWYVWPDDDRSTSKTMASTDTGTTWTCGAEARWGFILTGCLKHHLLQRFRFVVDNGALRFLWLFTRAVVRWCAVALGWSDGFVGAEPLVYPGAIGVDFTTAAATHSHGGAMPVAAGMGDDEFI